MIKKKLVVFLILFLSVSSFPQVVPVEYSIGSGKSLSKVSQSNSSNPLSNSVSDIITVGDTVWIGTGKGVGLSTDRGATWTNFYNNEAFGTSSISAIGYDKYTGNFWAAKAYDTDLNGQPIQTGGGLTYTTDQGRTWKTLPQPVDNSGDSSFVYGINDGVNLPKVRALPVTVPQQNLTFDIAFTPGTVWTTSWAGGLRKSTDMGATWQRVLLPSDKLNEISPNDTIKFSLSVVSKLGFEENFNHVAFSVVAVDDSTLYVGTADGINKTTNARDQFQSWTKFNHTNQQNPVSGNFVVALAYDQLSNTVWGATWKANGSTESYGVSSSTDGGENWQTFLEGQKVHNFGFKTGSVIAPSDNGAFRSNNNGISWLLPTSIVDGQTGLTLKTNTFYAAASHGSDIWVGTPDGLGRLTETPGTLWNGNWKLFVASQPLASKTETYAFPNPFSPKLDLLKIKYSTGGVNSPVTIRIFDFGMNYVRTVVQNVERGAPAHLVDSGTETNGVIDYWDGRDDKGSVVANGVYFYRVEVGSADPVYGKILVIQ